MPELTKLIEEEFEPDPYLDGYEFEHDPLQDQEDLWDM